MDAEDVERCLATYRAERSRYVAFGNSLAALLNALAESRGLAVLSVETRAKEEESLRRKLSSERYSSLDQITDLCGVRVILFYHDDVKALGDLLQEELTVIEVVRHGEEVVEQFGYQSDHFIVRLDGNRSALPEWAGYDDLVVEIQIRTVLQHAWAAISHKLDYKSAAEVPKQSRRRLFRAAALLETSDELFADFRSEIETLREAYSESERADEWRDLELDLDSLLTARHHLDLGSLVEHAVEGGWRTPNPDRVEHHSRSRGLGVLLAVADAAGMERLGDIEASIERYKSEGTEVYAQVAMAAENYDFTPWAYETDVFSIRLCVDHPDALTVTDFRVEVLKAVLDVANVPEEVRGRRYAAVLARGERLREERMAAVARAEHDG